MRGPPRWCAEAVCPEDALTCSTVMRVTHESTLQYTLTREPGVQPVELEAAHVSCAETQRVVEHVERLAATGMLCDYEPRIGELQWLSRRVIVPRYNDKTTQHTGNNPRNLGQIRSRCVIECSTQ